MSSRSSRIVLRRFGACRDRARHSFLPQNLRQAEFTENFDADLLLYLCRSESAPIQPPMKTKAELNIVLNTPNLWLPRHLPESTGCLYGGYRSIVTPYTLQNFPSILASDLYDAFVFENRDHPHSPLIIVNHPDFTMNPPGSGIFAQHHFPHESLNLLRFYSGRKDGWHGCAESTQRLIEKTQASKWIYSGRLI